MSYQKCPLCNGCGSTGEPCKVCGGTGIISEQTGKPPEYKYKTQSDTTEH